MKSPELVCAFQLAREEIRLNREWFICNAIYRQCATGRVSQAAADLAVATIRERLGDKKHQGLAYTVEDWLIKNVPDFLEWQQSVTRGEVSQAIRAYRCRWLDSLIGEFS